MTDVNFEQNVEPLVALSTAHLRQETAQRLADDELDILCYPNEYGGFIYVGADENISQYPELNTILCAARADGIVWLKFDADAAEVPGLETFEWHYPSTTTGT